jgi:hypothetical protein
LQHLESEISRSLENKPNFQLDQLDQELSGQLTEVMKGKAKLEQQIESEQKRLKEGGTAQASESQGVQEKLDDARDFLQTMPETIRTKSQALLEQFKRTDKVLYRDLLRSVARDGELLHYFRHGYDVNLEFEPGDTIRVADRSARTLSRLFQSLSEGSPAQSPVRYLSTVLRIASAVVTLALPKSLFNFLFFGYWIVLLYGAEVLIWLGGVLTGNGCCVVQ